MISAITKFSRYKIDSETATITNGDGLPIKPRVDGRSGYLKIDLIDDEGKRKTRLVHVLQAETFLGARPTSAHDVLHNDGKKFNCAASNLRYGTNLENGADRIAHGTNLPGELNAQACLSNLQARVFAWVGVFGHVSAAWLGNFANVNDETILRLWRRQSWRRVTKGIQPATRLRPLKPKENKIED